MKQAEAIESFRKITGLPLDTSDPQQLNWIYSDGCGTAANVTVVHRFGPNKRIFKHIQLVLSEDHGAIQMKLRLGPRYKQQLAAFLIKNGGVFLREELPIRVSEVLGRLQRAVRLPDDPAQGEMMTTNASATMSPFTFFEQVTGLALPHADVMRQWRHEFTKGDEARVSAYYNGNHRHTGLRALELLIIEAGGGHIQKLRYTPRNHTQPFAAFVARTAGDDVWQTVKPAEVLRHLHELTGATPSPAALALMNG